jgi:hypothetical protein
MTSDRKKPGVAFWATAVVVMLLVSYPLSIGPAHLIECSMNHPSVYRGMHAVYRPIGLVCRRSELATRIACRYTDVWGWRRPRLASGFWLPPGFEFEIGMN